MLVSLMVITTAVTAVILVVFGNQGIRSDDELNNIALYRTSEMIEKAKVDAITDFNSVVNSTSSYDVFDGGLAVNDISPCRKDIAGSISWIGTASRSQNIYLNTSLISIEEALALGGDCDLSGGPISQWWYPDTFKDYDLKTIEPPTEQSNNAGVPATSIDVFRRNGSGSKYAVITTNHSGENDVWIINVDDELNAFVASSLETTARGINNADVVSNNIAGSFVYALTAGSTAIPSQFQVINIGTITSPSLVATRSLDISSSDANFVPNATAIFYYGGKIYIGTHRTGGKEFQIFRGVSPYDRLGSLEIDHNVNDIVVDGDYAYLATSDDGCMSPPCAPNSHAGELMIVNINPDSPDYLVHPDITGTWYDAKSHFDATSLFLLGNKIYLGRVGGNYINSEAYNFLVLDISNPDSIILLGSKFIPDNNSPNKAAGIKALHIVSDFAFIATDVDSLDFQVYKISNPSEILNCGELSPPPYANCGKYNFPAKMTDLEFMDNFIYASIESNATFRIIFDDTSRYGF